MDTDEESLMLSPITTVAHTQPMVYGFSCDQNGLITELSWESVRNHVGILQGKWCWIHLNRESAEAQQ